MQKSVVLVAMFYCLWQPFALADEPAKNFHVPDTFVRIEPTLLTQFQSKDLVEEVPSVIPENLSSGSYAIDLSDNWKPFLQFLTRNVFRNWSLASRQG